VNGYQKYKKTKVESATKEGLMLMLYEAAIKFTKRAIIACEKNEIAERGMNIGRAYDIIMELNNTLNHEAGGEIAINLEQLYDFILRQYTQANIKGDAEILKSVLRLLETLNSGWVQAVEEMKSQKNSEAKK
jgi:flagellar protein FliS